jgi:predicted MFS family arabinose efflux permease
VAIQIVLVAAYVLVMANLAIMPTLLPYMRDDIPMSDADAALILVIFSVVAAPGNLFGGVLSDRYERGTYLAIGAATVSLSFFAMALLASNGGVVLTRVVCAVGMAMVASSIIPSVADRFPPDQRPRVTGFVMGGASIAPLVWQPLCAAMGGAGHWRLFACLFAVYAAILMAAALWFLPNIRQHLSEPERSEPDRSVVSELRKLATTASERRVANTLFAYCLCAMAVSLFTAMYPAWLHDTMVSSTAAAVVFICGGIGTAASAVILGYGPGKKANAWLIGMTSYAVLAFAIIAMWAGGSLITVQSVFFACFSAARSSYLAATMSTLMTVVHPSQRGAINGLLGVTFQSSVAIGSAFAVFAYSSDLTYGANTAAALVLLGLASVIHWRVLR